MNQLFEQFTAFFVAQEWTHHPYGDRPIIHTQVNGGTGRWLGVAIARVEDKAAGFLSIFPSRVAQPRRAACAELLTRFNYALRHGCFQMDWEDGELQFATSLMLPTQEITPEQVQHLILVNVSTMDERYDTIMRVIHGGMSPQQALAHKAQQAAKPKAPKAISKKRRFEMN